jgi:putative PIN family toxin of toxin-antitoxin system
VNKIVLDTNVLYSALYSQNGASYRLLSLLGTDRFEVAVSVPLVIEYEDALMRLVGNTRIRARDVDAVLDYLCSVAIRQSIFYLWRPLLRDPKDDHVAEVAVAAGCDAIVTFNLKDFDSLTRFGLQVMTPASFLIQIGEI